MVKNFFLISNLNLPSFSLEPFPLVLSLELTQINWIFIRVVFHFITPHHKNIHIYIHICIDVLYIHTYVYYKYQREEEMYMNN